MIAYIKVATNVKEINKVLQENEEFEIKKKVPKIKYDTSKVGFRLKDVYTFEILKDEELMIELTNGRYFVLPKCDQTKQIERCLQSMFEKDDPTISYNFSTLVIPRVN